MDRQTLILAMKNQVISDEEVAAFNDAMVRAGCTTVRRAAMFIAQVGHESVGLRYYSEIWGPSADQLTYNYRLGNNGPADAYAYRGSGPIQVTGKANFASLSKWAFSKGYVTSPTYFVDNPDDLRTIRFGFLGAVWYWTVERDLNSYADRGDIEGASIAINGRNSTGRANGIDDRISRWNDALKLGEGILPTTQGGFLMALDDNAQQQVAAAARQLGDSKTTWNGATSEKLAADYNPKTTGWARRAIERAALTAWRMAQRRPSTSLYRDSDLSIGDTTDFVQWTDGTVHQVWVELGALFGDKDSLARVKKAASAGSERAQALLDHIEEKK